MFITKKSLSRRTFLQAAGTTLALPFLDAMTPALSAAAMILVSASEVGLSKINERPRNPGESSRDDRLRARFPGHACDSSTHSN